jgi:hypothetical protein
MHLSSHLAGLLIEEQLSVADERRRRRGTENEENAHERQRVLVVASLVLRAP